jgi:hypothetical protein
MAGKATKIFFQQSTGDVAAQRLASVLLQSPLSLGGRNSFGRLAFGQPRLYNGLDELGFQPALHQQLVDAEELLAQLAIIDITFDGGQEGSDGQLKGNDGWVH